MTPGIIASIRNLALAKRDQSFAMINVADSLSGPVADAVHQLGRAIGLEQAPLDALADELAARIISTHNYLSQLAPLELPALAPGAPNDGATWEQCPHCSTIRVGGTYWYPPAEAWSETEPVCTRRDL